MAKRALSAAQVKALKGIGEHRVDRNLYLQIKENGARSWLYRWKADGRLRRKGLGAAADVSLSEAKAAADIVRAQIRQGIDPHAERNAKRLAKQTAQKVPTFKEVAAACIEARAAEWSDPTSRTRWEQSLNDYAFPRLGARPVDQIKVEDVLAVLKPIWQTRNPTADRLRSRIEAVLGYAIAHGYRDGPNPAQWRGGSLPFLLSRPSRTHEVEHFDALPYAEAPAFMKRLRATDTAAARAMELLSLTAARSQQVQLAKWDEFDLDVPVWSLSKERMKARRAFDVPLSKQAVELIKALQREGDYLFGGRQPIGKNALRVLIRQMHPTATPHGWRSTFKDWASERTDYPNEVSEMALAHEVGSKVERAYRRTDMLDQRRALLQDWADFLASA